MDSNRNQNSQSQPYFSLNNFPYDDLDVLEKDHQIYNTKHKRKFGLEYAWNVLLYEQKWLNCESMNPTPKATSSNKRKADDAATSTAPSSGSVAMQHENRPPGIKAMKRLRNKAKGKAASFSGPAAAPSAAPSADFSQMFELKQKDLQGMMALQKMSLLDTLIARRESLDEDEKVIKKKSEMRT